MTASASAASSESWVHCPDNYNLVKTGLFNARRIAVLASAIFLTLLAWPIIPDLMAIAGYSFGAALFGKFAFDLGKDSQNTDDQIKKGLYALACGVCWIACAALGLTSLGLVSLIVYQIAMAAFTVGTGFLGGNTVVYHGFRIINDKFNEGKKDYQWDITAGAVLSLCSLPLCGVASVVLAGNIPLIFLTSFAINIAVASQKILAHEHA